MDFVLFLVFGVFETYCIFALMFKSFSIPYFEYFKEITILGILATISSYLCRIIIGAPILYDMVASMLYLILFLRFIIKIKLPMAIIMVSAFLGYALISIGTYNMYSYLGIIKNMEIYDSIDLPAYIVQFSSSFISLTIAVILYKTRAGLNFIIRPPHNFFVKTTIGSNDIKILIMVIISATAFISAVFLLTRYQIIIGLPIYLYLYAVVVYLSYKRDLIGHDD